MSDTKTAAFQAEFRALTGEYLDAVVDCTAGLPVVIECYERDVMAFHQECQRISGLESDCDDLLGAVRTTVGNSMPPNFTGVYFQPGSVLELFVRVDEVANHAEQFCAELAAMRPALAESERADLVRMADLVVEGIETLATATADLRTALCGPGVETGVQSQVSTITRLESACDATRDKLLADVFADGPTTRALVTRELIVTLDDAMDAIEDAADHLIYVDSTMC
ncbi:MAG: DUF47 domain-containing protein [Halorientalis sp.]